MDSLPIIKRIEDLMKEKNIPKMKIYEDLRLSTGTFSQWKSGRNAPSDKSLLIIADYLNTTVEYLKTGSGQKEKPSPIVEGLTEAQEKVLRLFDSMTDQEQRALLATARGLIAARQDQDDL